MQSSLVQIKSKEGEIIEFRPEFGQFSTQVAEKDEDDELPVNVDKQSLQIMKDFLEAHDYNKDSIKVQKPLVSDNLSENLDPKSFNILKEYSGVKNIDKIKPLVDAAYYFGFEQFKDACLACLAYEFYVGPTESDLEKFKNKHGIKDLSPEEELEIMREFEPVFEQLNKKFKHEMDLEQKKFEQEENAPQD